MARVRFMDVPWAKPKSWAKPKRKKRSKRQIQTQIPAHGKRFFYVIGYIFRDGEPKYVIRSMGRTFRHIAEQEGRRIFAQENIHFDGVYPARGQPS